MRTRLLGMLVLLLLYTAACSVQPQTVVHSSKEGRTPVTAAHFDLVYTDTTGAENIWIPATGVASPQVMPQTCTVQHNFGRAFHLRCDSGSNQP